MNEKRSAWKEDNRKNPNNNRINKREMKQKKFNSIELKNYVKICMI